MNSDIKLEDDKVILEAKYAELRTWDLMLDSPDRRINKTGQRRALVHDPDDGLTINYNRDYPGGVKIKGEVWTEELYADGFIRTRDIRIFPEPEHILPLSPSPSQPSGGGHISVWWKLDTHYSLHHKLQEIFEKLHDQDERLEERALDEARMLSLIDRLEAEVQTLQETKAETLESLRKLQGKVAQLTRRVGALETQNTRR